MQFLRGKVESCLHLIMILNITIMEPFALADDEIDYTLYDPNHPEGSQYYDFALRNTPIFEPLTDETQCLKYKLVTLSLKLNIFLLLNLDNRT